MLYLEIYSEGRQLFVEVGIEVGDVYGDEPELVRDRLYGLIVELARSVATP